MSDRLPEKIIEEIKKQGIESRPRWQFLLKRWVLWLVAIFSTIVGGIAIAIIIFTFIDHDASARVYLKESAVDDILLTIPYFWLVNLALLIIIAKYVVRHTKFGYRYATARIVGAVLIGSALFGIALNAMDVGERAQDFLVEAVPYYDTLTYTSKDAWSHHEKGLLGGAVTAVASSEEFELIDFRKKIWQVDTSGMEDKEDLIIRQGVKIKIIGTQKDGFLFYAERIFYWNN